MGQRANFVVIDPQGWKLSLIHNPLQVGNERRLEIVTRAVEAYRKRTTE